MGGREGGRSGGVVNGVQDGRLNPSRDKGFQGARMDTPIMSDMMAKQGSILARFMTFFQRKCSLVIEMYEGAFYRQKPNWDRIAEFEFKVNIKVFETNKEKLQQWSAIFLIK